MTEGAARSTVLTSVASGWLSGIANGEVVSFLGIPYAEVPSGDGRFGPPGPAPSWDGVRTAYAPGPSSPQPGSVRARLILGASPPSGSECLVVNVWTPDPRAGAGLPVLVWLHGGAFTNGSGAVAALDGARLAHATDAVVVTVNYRLGAPGFAYHPSLGDGCGNAGLYDQQAALSWVHREIASFGGDPARVTLAGDSAGSMATALHSILPSSRSLFSQVSLHSGTPSLQTPDAAAELTQRLADQLGLRPDALRSVSSAELVRATAEMDAAPRFGPVAIGELAAPLAELKAAAPPLPHLINTTADEGTFFLVDARAPRAVTRREAVSMLDALLGDGSDRYARAERTVADDRRGDPRWALSHALTDAMFDGPADAWASAAAARGGRVWRSRYARPARKWDGWLGATHTLDVPVLFANHHAEELSALFDGDESIDDVTRDLQRSLRSFLHTGIPDAGWPVWKPASRNITTITGSC
ncbi:carboxylesterase family protein [Streptomyces sp. NPDC091219]|uniref:carboxylesterase/lipase family protein n=1 Tax=Streptomyces sp. NPDC091219 TaxID=3155193 RepID=UPI00344EBE63